MVEYMDEQEYARAVDELLAAARRADYTTAGARFRELEERASPQQFQAAYHKLFAERDRDVTRAPDGRAD